VELPEDEVVLVAYILAEDTVVTEGDDDSLA
jgi:hypothetical protein